MDGEVGGKIMVYNTKMDPKKGDREKRREKRKREREQKVEEIQ